MKPPTSDLQAALETFLRYCRSEKGLTLTTCEGYRRIGRDWLRWFASEHGRAATIEDWTEPNASAYHASLKTSRKRQTTRRRNIASLRSWGNWLAAQGMTLINPWVKIRTPVNEELRQPCPSAAEVKALFEACDRIPNRLSGMKAKAALALTALAGLRMCELIAVRVEDLSLTGERRFVTVTSGKGGIRRTVPLNVMAVDILSCWLMLRPATDLPLLLFLRGDQRQDRPYTTCAFNGMLAKVKAIAQLRDLDCTCHALRRFAGTSIAQQQGASLADAQRFLGHSDMTTTLRYLKRTNDLQALVEGILTVPAAAPAPPRPAADNRVRPVQLAHGRRPAWRRGM